MKPNAYLHIQLSWVFRWQMLAWKWVRRVYNSLPDGFHVFIFISLGPTQFCPGKKLRFYHGWRCPEKGWLDA